PVAGEDELLLLQSQAQAEEEAAKKKEKMLALFLKDKLAKEERNSTLNNHRLNAEWWAVLRGIKDKELRTDINILRQTFAQVMDCKDRIIKARPTCDSPPPCQPPQSLATALEDAEEQHAEAMRCHLNNIDHLLELQRCRLSSLEEWYSAQLDSLKLEFEAERYQG
ncbi:DRC2 protein, partial [Heliornis fulica]|nr:DRC2 protein [Heliornis fulica]